MTSLSRLRQSILAREGVERSEAIRWAPSPAQVVQVLYKTPKALYLELRYNVKIENILFAGDLFDVCEKLGFEVDKSTVCRWRQRVLRLIYSAGIWE